MPVTQPDLWKAPPFEGRLVEQAPFKKVLIGRGADQLQGPADGACWNAFMSIKAWPASCRSTSIFVAEGDEERMSMGYRKFVKDHPRAASRAPTPCTASAASRRRSAGGSEGCVFVELTTSGEKWGRGPN